jgi:diguanylate cyclase (GGDEF)-like protein
MRTGIWLLLIFLPVILFSQLQYADSTSLHKHIVDQRIETLWRLSDSLATIDPAKAIVYTNLAILAAEKSGDIESQALSLNRLSALQLQRGHLDEALVADQKALSIYHRQPELSGYMNALDINASVYDRMIKILESDNVKVRKRNLSIFALLLLFISFLFISMYQLKSNSNKELIKANKEIQSKNEELTNAYHILDLVARNDPLTNLSNRRDIMEKLKYAQILFERNHKPFSIIMIDLDLFKEINDSFGHDAGDYALVYLAKLIQKAIRKQDIVSRWGGDEFLLLLPDTDLKGGKIVADKIRSHMASKSCIHNHKLISFTLSAGVSCYSEESDIDTCIKKADEALYLSKKNGRNQVTLFEETATSSK